MGLMSPESGEPESEKAMRQWKLPEVGRANEMCSFLELPKGTQL